MKANHSLRVRVALSKEVTELKRRNKQLEANLARWTFWYIPISQALNEGDNLRALALLKSENAPTQRRTTHGPTQQESIKAQSIS